MSHIVIKLAPTTLAARLHFDRDPVGLAEVFSDRYVIGGEFDVKESGEEAAEEVFDLTNNPSRQEERELLYGRGRSVSVGDVVVVDKDSYLCANMGWTRLENFGFFA